MSQQACLDLFLVIGVATIVMEHCVDFNGPCEVSCCDLLTRVGYEYRYK